MAPRTTPTSAAGFQETPDSSFCLLSVGGFDLFDVVRLTYSSSSLGLEERIRKRLGLTQVGNEPLSGYLDIRSVCSACLSVAGRGGGTLLKGVSYAKPTG